MRGNKLITPVDLTNFMIVFTQRDYDKASDFVRTLSTVGPPMGINIGNPETVELQNDRIDSFMRAIESHLTPKTQMVCAAYIYVTQLRPLIILSHMYSILLFDVLRCGGCTCIVFEVSILSLSLCVCVCLGDRCSALFQEGSLRRRQEAMLR